MPDLLRAVLSATAGLILAAVLLSAPVSSQEAPPLRERITDQTGVLRDDLGEIEAALDELSREENIQLFVLFVETTGGAPVTDYAEEAALSNSLGSNDALLVVALTDRSDAVWVGPGLDEVSDGELDDLIADEIEPRLADGEFGAAVVAAAQGLGDAAGGDGSSWGTTGLIVLFVAVGTTVLFVVGLVALAKFMTWRRNRREAEERSRETREVARQANSLLIEADDELRAAEQELGFAEAQFGEREVQPFREALAKAHEEMRHAFTLRQRIDDAEPETADEQRKLLAQIVARAQAARDLLKGQQERVAQLRDLQRTVPELLPRIALSIEQQEGRLPEIEAAFARLSKLGAAAAGPVAGNVAEARKRLVFAKEEVARGQRALAADDRTAAVASARSAERAAAETAALLDAVESLERSAIEARDKLAAELQAAQADLDAATAAVASGTLEGREDQLEQARTTLDSARRETSAGTPDYLTAYRLAVEANALADAVLAESRAAEERRRRERELVDHALASAESSYRRAADFIAARRNGVGRQARTRLAEAERHLSRAQQLSDSDPARATQEAQQAARLADEAQALGVQDFERYDRYRGGGFGAPPIDIFSLLLGGIFGLPGGSGRRWGSTGGGTVGRSGSGRSGGFGRMRGGGFGGRSGGGRARGGRW